MSVMGQYIIADNQDITRAGLISILKEMNERASITEVANYNELLTSLRDMPRSVVVVDYSLFDFLSMNHFLNMKSGAKESSWLLFSYEAKEHFLRKALLADPTFSVVMKQSHGWQVKEALAHVSAGEVYWCEFAESIMKVPAIKERLPDQLTVSEKNILREIALGKLPRK